MEKKSPYYEGSARKRRSRSRSNAAATQQQQQQQLLPIVARKQSLDSVYSKVSTLTKTLLGEKQKKSRQAAGTVAVVPPIRQWNNSSILSGNSSSNINAKRCSSAREPERRMRCTVLPPLTARACPASTCNVSVVSFGGQSQPMRAAHEELERLLAGFDQATELSATTAKVRSVAAAPTPRSPPVKRRKKAGAKVARRQPPPPLPVPTVSPLHSGRRKDNIDYDHLQLATAATHADETLVPLTVSPQMLTPEKRLALLELLSRAEQNDQQIVKILQGELSDAIDSPKEAQRRPLQIALTPGNSPYWLDQDYPRECQKEQQQQHKLQLRDLPSIDVKQLSTPRSKFMIQQTLEQELNDEVKEMDLVQAKLQSRKLATMSSEQRAREQQAFDERIELDRQKQQMSELRSQHRDKAMRSTRTKLTKHRSNKLERQMLQQLAKNAKLDEQRKDASNVADASVVSREYSESVKDVLRQRQKFQEQCKRSSLYNSSKYSVPWSLFATITSKMSLGISNNVKDELHRSIACFIKETRNSKSRHSLPPK